MKARFVYENINFERGLDDPFRSLDIGQYAKIRKELEESPDINIEDAKNDLEELAVYWAKSHSDLREKARKVFSQYSKDSYHVDKVSFVKDMVLDVVEGGGKISEREFIDWIIKYTEDVDYDPTTLLQEIEGLLYAVQME